VEHLAWVDAVRDELIAGGVDIGDDQVQALRRAGRGRRHVRTELNGTPRARRRELDDPEPVVKGKVGVEPPSEALVELLSPVDIGDGDDERLEFHVDAHDTRVMGDFGGAHGYLPGSCHGATVAPCRLQVNIADSVPLRLVRRRR
jgi:hypothetical protein